jgi:formate-dependent nitrite reductase membrane component NrfD
MKMLEQRARTTGRELDDRFAVLTGEGAGQRVRQPEPRKGTTPVPVWEKVPSLSRHPNYYGLPLLKEPVWIWSVPVYFYVGGVAGGSAVLAAFLHGKPRGGRLASICGRFAFLGTTLGSGLLTWDLGRKLRFFNMLRVFRPSSPMSIGSWTLAGTGFLAALSLLFKRGAVSLFVLWGEALGGTVLAGYTGVLLANTANPLWQGTRLTLPVLFEASAVATTSALLEMFSLNATERRIVKRFGTIGKVAEAGSMAALEVGAARNPSTATVFYSGASGVLWKAAKACLAAGIILNLLPGTSSSRRRVGGILTTIGAVCMRFALFEAGKKAARDPMAVIRQQTNPENRS